MDPGHRIAGRYRPVAVLGRGGMGTVWHVVDEVSGEALALKHADGGRMQGPQPERNAARFRREFHTLASLRHPRIVRALDFGVDPGGAYYTMELLDGSDLKDAGPLPWPDALRVLRDVAAALGTLHARGLVHRDLAPRNVRRCSDGRAVLFDFGLLASMGIAGDVAGTPTAIAPETLRGQPIDGRTDLFGLGTLAYWLLTGDHAFAARKLGDLEDLWRTPPPPVSQTNPALPVGLDGLVASMLAIDPLARPGSAAEVIDRLGTLLGDVDDPLLEVSRGYLASVALVGRSREMALVQECIGQVVGGRGRCIVIEAGSGFGKSRVLREIGLCAQLAGMRVVEGSGDLGQAPWGVMQHLVDRAIAVAPELVPRVPTATRVQLARLFPGLGPRLGVPPGATRGGAEPVAEPAEQRLRVHAMLVGMWRELAAMAPLALVVDDVQRCDEASAAVLAALVRAGDDRPLLVAAGLRTGESARAAAAIEAIAGADARLRLRGLEESDVHTLVESAFGSGPHTRRLAHWLHARSAGSPLLCTELLRMLCDDGTVRLVDGMWLLPAEYDAIDLPSELTLAMDARIATLSADARALAEILAVIGEPLGLDELLGLAADDLSERRVFAALDELIAASVVLGSAFRHGLRHDGLREAVIRGTAAPRKVALHLRVGAHLEARGAGDVDQARIGWHLLEGGARRRGAELLAKAGQRSFRDQALVDCVAPLEAALGELRSDPACSRLCLELRFMLVSAGWVSDRAAGLRHMDDAVESLRQHAGLALAARLAPWVGRHVALVVGVLLTGVGWVCSRPSRRGPSPFAALATFAVTVGYACGLEYANHNRAGLQRLIDSTRPLAVFRSRLIYATHLGLTAFPDLMLGRLGDARAKLERVLAIIARDRITPIGEFERSYAEAGILSLVAQIQITNLDPDLPTTLTRMRAHGLRYYDLVAGVTEAAALRFRGLEPQARAIEHGIESTALQLGSWSTDVQRVLFGHPPYGAAGDPGNLKRMVGELERLLAQGFNYGGRLEMTRGDLCRARDEPEVALEHYARALTLLDDDELLTRVWILAGTAEAEIAIGRFEAALGHAELAASLASDPASGQLSVRLRGLRAIALALGGLGQRDAAERAAAIALAAAEDASSAMAIGLAHEARARIARMFDDGPTFHLHAGLAAKVLRGTGSGALAALAERLLGSSQDPGAATSGSRRRAAAEASDDVTSLSQLATSHEPPPSDHPASASEDVAT